MKLAAAILLALALAVDCRQLAWEAAGAGGAGNGYGYTPFGSAEDPTYDYVYIPVSVQEASPQNFGAPYTGTPYNFGGGDPREVSPSSYSGRPYPAYPTQASPSAGSAPYYAQPYYPSPPTEASPAACTTRTRYTCDAPSEVAGTCGASACALPNLCLTITRTVRRQVEVPVPVCAQPKLVCHEIEKPCGESTCGYDETCVKSQVCRKVPSYPPPATVSPQAGGEAPVRGEPAAAVATANAYATSTPGSGPAVANANAYATSSPSPAPATQVDGAAGGEAPYRPACEDTFVCEKIDPKVCKTEPHQICVEKDPKSAEPGYFQGYPLGWQPGYEVGQRCGDDVCKPGSFCATCEVEICLDAVIEKDAAQCGYDPQGVPTFCPSGHMCTELCPPEKKYVTVEVEDHVCVAPSDETYADEVAAAITPCGPHQCLPGYECNATPYQVCGSSPLDPTGVDGAAGEEPRGYYFFYDPNGSADSGTMPGYHFYPHDLEGNDAGCGYYLYPRPESASPQATSPQRGAPARAAPTPYYSYPAGGADTTGNAGADPYYYYPAAGGAGGDPYYYYPAAADTTGNSGAGSDPYYGYPYPYNTGTDGDSAGGAGDNPYYYFAVPSPRADSGSRSEPQYYSYPYDAATTSPRSGRERGAGRGNGKGKGYYYTPRPAPVSGGAGEGTRARPYRPDELSGAGSGPTARPYIPDELSGAGAGPKARPYIPDQISSGGAGPKARPYIPDQISSGGTGPKTRARRHAGKQTSGEGAGLKSPSYVPPPPPPADQPTEESPASGGEPSYNKVTSVSMSNGDSVYVWGSSDTSGDSVGEIHSTASSGDDTSATIKGGSSYGNAKVDCDTKAAEGMVAGCDGDAKHN